MPLHRRHHTCTLFGATRLLIFGGLDRFSVLHNALYSWDFAAGSWGKVRPSGEMPTARYRHVAIAIKDELVIYGGSDLRQPLGDLWIYSNHLNAWRASQPRRAAARARERSCAVEYKRRLLVFGGFGGTAAASHTGFSGNPGYLDDLSQYDPGGDEWTELEVNQNGPQPSPRAGHACVIFGGSLFVFGGTLQHSWYQHEHALGDMWEFDFNAGKWHERLANAATPPPRHSHTMDTMGRIVLFGGTDGKAMYNDFWQYDVYQNAWQRGSVDPDRPSPSPRYEHGAVSQGMHYCILGGFGGFNGIDNAAFLNDLWCINTATEWKMTWQEHEGVPLNILEMHNWHRDIPRLEAVGAHNFLALSAERPGAMAKRLNEFDTMI